MWKFNGKELNPDKLPTMEEVVAGIHALGGRDADKNAILRWDYGEYGSDVAYWHSLDPADKDGIILMPVREGVLSIPFGTGNHLFSPDGLQVENVSKAKWKPMMHIFAVTAGGTEPLCTARRWIRAGASSETSTK